MMIRLHPSFPFFCSWPLFSSWRRFSTPLIWSALFPLPHDIIHSSPPFLFLGRCKNALSLQPNFQWFHFAVFFFYLLLLLLPFPVYHWRSRLFLLRHLLRTCIAPFRHVHFKDLFLADQLTSLMRVSWDLFYSFCFISSISSPGSCFHIISFPHPVPFPFSHFVSSECACIGRLITVLSFPLLPCHLPPSFSFLAVDSDTVCVSPTLDARWVLSFLPFLFRVAQCLRRFVEEGHDRIHLLNAGKYLSSCLVTLFSLLSSRAGQ